MNEDRYKVCDRGQIIARDMTLEMALILAKAYFEKFYAEPFVSVEIIRQKRGELR